MTHDVIEQMVGHRTRLAQQQPARWHQAEDQFLGSYTEFSRAWTAPRFICNCWSHADGS